MCVYINLTCNAKGMQCAKLWYKTVSLTHSNARAQPVSHTTLACANANPLSVMSSKEMIEIIKLLNRIMRPAKHPLLK